MASPSVHIVSSSTSSSSDTGLTLTSLTLILPEQLVLLNSCCISNVEELILGLAANAGDLDPSSAAVFVISLVFSLSLSLR